MRTLKFVSVVLLLIVISLSNAKIVQAGSPTDIFISEYVEGSSNNKGLEIYNGTGASIDLAAGNYVVQFYFNGSASAGHTIALSGNVADGDVFVVADSSAVFAGSADQTQGGAWFNGDDAVVLKKGGASGTILDVIGQVGTDPGNGWGSEPTTTVDSTLRRKLNVCTGDTNPNDAFDPAVEWNGFELDDFTGLGSHTVDCNILVVNSTGDGPDNNPGNGMCETSTAGECTLRAAIMESNALTSVANTIQFNISGGGVRTINLTSALPDITQPVTIDGLAQPGATCDGWPAAPNLLVELNGSNVPVTLGNPPTPPTGLHLKAGTSTVHGLVINNFTKNILNVDVGIGIRVSSDANTISCNFIGTNAAGQAAAANAFGIAMLNAATNVISGNLISANSQSGIAIVGDGGEAQNNTIRDNYIGTDKNGTADLGNAKDGVLLVNAKNNPIQDNLIAGNGGDGLDMTDFVGTHPDFGPIAGCTTPPCATGNTITGNKIGTGKDGNVTTLGNGKAGIQIEDAEGNTIQNNTIAGNSQNGVLIKDQNSASCSKGTNPCAINNKITQNSLFDNGSLGIDLTLGTSADGVTANDANDTDNNGGNRLQNFPVLDSVNGTTIQGRLNSTANRTFRLEFFSNTSLDGSGYGEGKTYLGSLDVTTDGSGNASFSFSQAAVDGQVTATATDLTTGDTSEFSKPPQTLTSVYLPVILK